ncbi:Protein T2 [Quaeritorhiza haematococci]|nr:Protein T2 [Quaeritorhiza haematococci]
MPGIPQMPPGYGPPLLQRTTSRAAYINRSSMINGAGGIDVGPPGGPGTTSMKMQPSATTNSSGGMGPGVGLGGASGRIGKAISAPPIYAMDEEFFPGNEDLQPPLLRSPLFSADAMVLLCPHLIDAIAGSLPPDAWDWESTEVPIAAVGKEEHKATTEAPKEEKKQMMPQDVMEATMAALQKDKRGYVVCNLWETETNYFYDLGILRDLFRKRMLEEGIITETAANVIFAGIDDLFNLHAKFSARMDELVALGSWSTETSRIGQLFIEHKSELVKIYTKFIDSYAISQREIKKEEKNPEYQAFLKKAAEWKETKKELKEFFILPVQRTTRYHLLLKELLKYTSEDHPDYEDLKKAWEAMNELADEVNEKKRREEESTGLFEAFEKTKDCPATLINAKRRMILSSDAIDVRAGKPCHLFLCSDLLMVCGIVTRGLFNTKKEDRPFKFVKWLDLLDITVEDLSVGHGDTYKDTIKITITPPSSSSSGISRSESTTSSSTSISGSTLGATSTSSSVGTPSSANNPNSSQTSSTTSGSSSATSSSLPLPPRKSLTTPESALTQTPLLFKFEGYDAGKNRITFMQAVQNEIKKCRESYLNGGGGGASGKGSGKKGGDDRDD